MKWQWIAMTWSGKAGRAGILLAGMVLAAWACAALPAYAQEREANAPDAYANALYLPAIGAGGAMIHVTTAVDELRVDGDCALREAVEAANTDKAYDGCAAGLGFDTIVIPAGEYKLTRIGAVDNRNVTGDLDIRSMVRIEGAGADVTFIDGNASDRVLDIQPGAAAVVTGVAIRNGYGRLSSNYALYGGCGGGGILNAGELVLRNAALYNNRTVKGAERDPNVCGDGAGGGGICNAIGASAWIAETLVYQNTTGDGGSGCLYREGGGGHGGGIFNGGNMSIVEVTAYYNGTGRGFPGGAGGNGGALYNLGSLVVVSTTVHSNRSGDGSSAPDRGFLGGAGSGAGIFNSGSLSVTSSAIYDNYTGTDSTDHGSGGEGGGIANRGAFTLTNSTVSRNLAQENGGGGIFSSIALVIDSSTIASNTAEIDGGGLQVISGTLAHLRNSILAGNGAKVQGPDCSGAFASFGHNLVQTDAGCAVTGDGDGDLVNQQAQLLPLGDYGGPTWTHALDPASPAMDTGDCTGQLGVPVEVDQRGMPRPYGAACDIGAVEQAPVDPAGE